MERSVALNISSKCIGSSFVLMLFFYVPFKMALELFYGQAGREEDGEEEQEEEEEYLPPIPTRNIQQTSGTGQEVPLTTRKPPT